MKEPADRPFHTLSVGMTASVVRIISQADVEVFRQLSGNDQNPIHTNISYAQNHGFKKELAYGALLGALLSELVGMKLPGRHALCVTQAFEFKKPFFVGDSLKLVGTVTRISPAIQMIELSLNVTRNSETVATGSAHVRVLE